MSGSNVHDNIFEIFAGVSRRHLEKVMSDQHPDEYSLDRWAERVAENDIWASDLLWNSMDLPHYIPLEHYRAIKTAIAHAVLKNDPVAIGQILIGYMNAYINQALNERREASDD